MAITRIFPSAAAAAATVAALLVLTAATPCPSTLYLYHPVCEWNYVNTTYGSCECTDTPCGFFRYEFMQNDTDKHRAYLYQWTGCRGEVTLVKRTTRACDIFNFRSVKICPRCNRTVTGAEAGKQEVCAGGLSDEA